MSFLSVIRVGYPARPSISTDNAAFVHDFCVSVVFYEVLT